MAAKPKLEFVHGEKIEAFLLDRTAKTPARQSLYGGDPSKLSVEDVLRQAIDRMDYERSWFNSREDQDKVVKAVCKKCCKEYETAQVVWVSPDRTVKAFPGAVYAFPGTEDEALSALVRSFDEVDVEEKLAPLLREEFKGKVHHFLASRAIFARRGGRYKAKQFLQHWAEGYMVAWEKFDGARMHPRPYILAPKYGDGRSGVAYLLAIPPEQLLEEAENEFAVHLVHSS